MAERKKTAASPTARKTNGRTASRGSKNVSKSGTGAKKAPAKTAKTKKLSAEVKGIILIALGIFAAISMFTEATGIVGHFFRQVIMGLFGGAAWMFFVYIIWTGVTMFTDKQPDTSSAKIWTMILLMIVTSVLWSVFSNETAWYCDSFVDQIQYMFVQGADGYAGGVIGITLCVLLVKCLGTVGTTVAAIAAAMILIVLLTEVSFEKIFRRIAASIKKNRESVSARLDSEVETEPEPFGAEDEAEQTPEKTRRRKKTARGETGHIPPVDITENPGKMPNSSYFDIYFKDDDMTEITSDMESHAEKPQHADGAESGKNEVKIHRFTFEEDMPEHEAESAHAADENAETEHGAHDRTSGGADSAYSEPHSGAARISDTEDDAPFDISDIKTGVLTEIPDENGNFKTGNGEFEPPSLVQMQERVDPMTQAAIDAGVPLDSAVAAGKRINREEAQQAANLIGTMAKEHMEAAKPVRYKLPSVALLAKPKPKTKSRAEIKKELEDKANKLLETLASFKVDAKILDITQGPTVTRFELQPGFGIKVSKITNLADDIALSLAASGVRIEAPIPGKAAIGIEIPNATATAVPIREVIDTDKFRDFKSKTAFALGKDISGNCIVADIAQFPHILIAGATGSGKSVCINSLITSILYKAKPDEVKLIMVDPKKVELGVYNGIPHLLIPVVTDPKHAAGALNWAVAEMKNRYKLMEDNKVRNLQGFNRLMEEEGTPENKLPEIVIIIDELADLMMAAKNEVEDSINSLAALARAAGMYLVIATQRPSVDVITGVIKANVPSRIAFAVSSQVDSRTIIDAMGAEKLLGKGDMLYAPRGAIKPMRIQGNFVSDSEIEDIVAFIKKQYEASYDESILEHIEREQDAMEAPADDEDDHMRGGERDELFGKAAELVIDSGQASVAMLQRRFKVGYQRAARIIDQMEEYHVIGPYEGTKPRQVLMTRNELNEMLMYNPD